jgi:Signal transduction histidine kinase regulating citrate/malate metabolism
MRVEAAAATSTAELAATFESIADGVLVIDLAGNIRNFNRRFSALWDLPEEMLLLRADDEVLDWMRTRVESPVEYTRRLAEIEADPMLRATDTLRLRSGALLERVTLPQLSRGRRSAASSPTGWPRRARPNARARRLPRRPSCSRKAAPGSRPRYSGGVHDSSERPPCPRSPVPSSSASGH